MALGPANAPQRERRGLWDQLVDCICRPPRYLLHTVASALTRMCHGTSLQALQQHGTCALAATGDRH